MLDISILWKSHKLEGLMMSESNLLECAMHQEAQGNDRSLIWCTHDIKLVTASR